MTGTVDLTDVRPAVEWLKDFLRHKHDVLFTHVVHRPPMWCFYDADGNFLLKIEEGLMDRLYFALNRDETLSYDLSTPENSLAQELLGDTWEARDAEADEPATSFDDDEDEDAA